MIFKAVLAEDAGDSLLCLGIGSDGLGVSMVSKISCKHVPVRAPAGGINAMGWVVESMGIGRAS